MEKPIIASNSQAILKTTGYTPIFKEDRLFKERLKKE